MNFDATKKDELITKTSTFLRVMMLVPSIGVLYWIIEYLFSSDKPYGIVTIVVYAIVWFGLWLPEYIQYFRTVTINKKGVKVKCLFYKKSYTWEEFSVKRIERLSYTDVTADVILSVRPVKKKRLTYAREHCLQYRRLFDSVCLKLLPTDDKAEILSISYREFMEKMQEWGIEFEDVLMPETRGELIRQFFE